MWSLDRWFMIRKILCGWKDLRWCMRLNRCIVWEICTVSAMQTNVCGHMHSNVDNTMSLTPMFHFLFWFSASLSGNVGVLHVLESEENLDWVLRTGPHSPYLVILESALFTRCSTARQHFGTRSDPSSAVSVLWCGTCRWCDRLSLFTCFSSSWFWVFSHALGKKREFPCTMKFLLCCPWGMPGKIENCNRRKIVIAQNSKNNTAV